MQGEVARLFPVLATTSKEGRTTSIVLSCISNVNEFGKELLKSVGVKTGKKASVEAYTEVVFNGCKEKEKDRPDGFRLMTKSNPQKFSQDSRDVPDSKQEQTRVKWCFG